MIFTQKKQKLFYSFIILLILLASLFTFYQYEMQKKFFYKCIDDKLKNVAYSGAFLLGDTLNNRDFNTTQISSQQNKKNALLLSKLTDENDVKFVYTMIKHKGKIYFTSSSITKEQYKNNFYIPYLLEYKGATPKLKASFENHQSYFGEATDEYGTFRSIIMPRKTKDGYWYLIGADIDVSFVKKQLHSMLFDYILAFAIFLAGLILFIQMFKKITDEENKENLQRQKALLEQSKLAQMGEMIGNIAHQWRQPLGEINAILMKLEGDYQNKQLNAQKLDTTLQQIENVTEYMSDTIENFSNYINKNKYHTEFSITDALNKALALIDTEIQKNGIQLDLQCKEDSLLKGVEGEFIQVVMVILQNAKDALKEEKEKHIDIHLYKEEDQTILTIYNNGKAIQKENMSAIFEPYFTTKFKSKGTGIGLYIAKMIIEKEFQGSLEVANINNGVEFKIVL